MSVFKAEGYYVWNPDAERPTFQHNDALKAIAEAERLARNHPGQEFIVLHALGSAMTIQPGKFNPAPGVDIDNHIPF